MSLNPRDISSTGTLNCEFTLALNNRTGKYFFCKDMIDASRDLINTCYYWRFTSRSAPSRAISRILGRLALIEVNARARWQSSYRILPPIRRRRPTVFTDPRECVLYALKSCDVVLCHDMGPLISPEIYDEGTRDVYALAFARIAKAKPLMLFVSEATRRDFVGLYGANFPLLQVIHVPLRTGMLSSDEQVVEGVPDKFLLTVGSLGTRKNQVRSIAAFEASGLADKGYGYVLCGGPEPGVEDVISASKRTVGVMLLGYVNDGQLRWLYRNARGFVLTSLLEGFGLPAAEAVSYGQVPLVSAGGALEEVAGEGALIADARDIANIADGMRRLASMSGDERDERLAKLRARIGGFSSEAAISAWRSALSLALEYSRVNA